MRARARMRHIFDQFDSLQSALRCTMVMNDAAAALVAAELDENHKKITLPELKWWLLC